MPAGRRTAAGRTDHAMNTAAANAWETCAHEFLAARDGSTIGARIVHDWARSLAPGTDVLEIGCGGGLPVSRVLVDAGLELWAVDSSPTLVSAFTTRFPQIPVDCSCATQSRFFARRFSGVIAIGVLFLLEPAAQAALIERVAGLLRPSGRFLFSAPAEAGRWADRTTGHGCESLGRARYTKLLEAAGLRVLAMPEDEGGNHHYAATKVGVAPPDA